MRLGEEKRQKFTGKFTGSNGVKVGIYKMQGVLLLFGKSKGEPDNDRKQGELHEPLNDRV